MKWKAGAGEAMPVMKVNFSQLLKYFRLTKSWKSGHSNLGI